METEQTLANIMSSRVDTESESGQLEKQKNSMPSLPESVGAGLMTSNMDFKLPQEPSTRPNREDRVARNAQIDGDNFEDEIKSRKLDVTKL
jgi:hypothetical protein